ncbi:MAG: TonB-dependent receptor [Oceanococcus sp.]
MKIKLGVQNSGFGLLLVMALAQVNGVYAQDSDDELDALFGPINSSEDAPVQATQNTTETEEAAPQENVQAAEEPDVVVLPESEQEEIRQPSRSAAIEEIVVTATKREQSVRDLVGSIDAFSGDALIEKGATGLEEILKFSPGVTVATGTDGETAQVSFRGILSESGSNYFGRTFGLFYGDVSLINPTFRGSQPNIDPWDMATVEVLKGPQGTLFGGGALSGAVRYVPNKPEFDEFYGASSTAYMQSGHSEDSGYAQHVTLNVPLNEQLAFRVAGGLQSRPGYVDDLHRDVKDINSSSRTNGRLMARWEPTERWAMNFQVMQRRFELDDGGVANNRERPETDDKRLSDYTQGNVQILMADIEYDLGWGALRGLFSQLEKDHYIFGDATAALGLQDTDATAYQTLDTQSSQPAFELRLISNAPTSGGALLGGWDYILGAYMVRSDQLLEVFIDVPEPTSAEGVLSAVPLDSDITAQRPDTLYSYGRADAVEQAVFLDLNRQLTKTLKLSLGARWFKQESEAVMYDEGGGQEIDRTEATPKDSGISPKLGLIWDMTEHMSLVTSAARGFRYGGVNVLPPSSSAPRTYGSDFLWNYELGMRTEWLDRRLQVDLTGYYIDWTDLQISQLTEDELFVYVANVGAARSQGVELSMKASLPWGLMFQSGGSYTDARTAAVFESDKGTVPAGTRLPASPYYSAFASLTSSWQLSEAAVKGGIDAAWQGSSYSNLQKAYTLPGYNTLGLSLSASWGKLPLTPELRLNVTNLTNKTVIGGISKPARGDIRTTFIQPRLATLTLGLHF